MHLTEVKRFWPKRGFSYPKLCITKRPTLALLHNMKTPIYTQLHPNSIFNTKSHQVTHLAEETLGPEN